ncbi:MAG: hypothetical protein ABJF88_00815 [Rhodothermales bacterium]
MALLLVPALALTGCDSTDDEDENGNATFGGTYEGRYIDPNDNTLIALEIPDTASGSFAFTGTSTLHTDRPNPTTSSYTGTGTYNHPNLALTIEDEFGQETIGGTVSDDRDTITITTITEGGEAEAFDVVLRRQ